MAAGTQGPALTAGKRALFTVLVLLAGVELTHLHVRGQDPNTLVTLGHVVMTLFVVGSFMAVLLTLVAVVPSIYARRPYLNRLPGHMVVAAVSMAPAVYTAYLVTEGHFISNSIYHEPLFAAVTIGLVMGVVLAVRFTGTAMRLPLFRRFLVATWVLLLGGAALAITSFHPLTYMRPHRCILCIAVLLLWLGVTVLIGARRDAAPDAGPAAPWSRWHTLPPALIVLFIVARLLMLTAPSGRLATMSLLFEHSLMSQKLLPLLAWLGTPLLSAELKVQPFVIRRGPPVPPLSRGRFKDYNVVIVSVDALRGDSVGYMSHREGLSPNIDDAARQSVIFRHAITNYSHTTRSIRSLLAGSWEVAYGEDGLKETRPEHWSAKKRMPALFNRAGYQTAAIMLGGRWGAEFFERQDLPEFKYHSQVGPTCMQQVDEFARYLQREANPHSTKHLIWMHIFDTHTPLQYTAQDVLFGEGARGKYLAAIHAVDRCFGRVVAELRRAGIYDRTVFVFFSDHGESLGEHGRSLEHSTCYHHDIDVPLFIRLPGAASKEVAYRLQTVDILPTLANLVGLDVRGEPFTGRDMSGLLLGDGSDHVKGLGWAFSEGHLLQYPCISFQYEQWQLIYFKDGGFYELYNIQANPGEAQNEASTRFFIVSAMKQEIDRQWTRPRK